MKLSKLLLSLFLIAMTVLFSCQKELSSLDLPAFGAKSTAPNITTSISGRVVDEQYKPVAGANVKAGTSSAVTNMNGEFTITNAFVYDDAAFVQVSKTGYFPGSRTFVARANSKHYVEIKLLPKTTNGTIVASAGGTVTLTNGTSVTLPALAVVDAATNAAYTGNVNVAIAWIDPTGADLSREMPGDLRGINESNAEMGMQSFGMVAVELSGDAGQKLQVALGKKATLKFYLPASISGTAPATIPLWSFDETTGLWKQEGSATKSGDFYSGDVSHFSFWNCDAQFPVVDFAATVKDQNGQPLQFKTVRIKRLSTNSWTYGVTDSAGVVKGKIPLNEALLLEVVATYNCGNTIHSQNIGPFTKATSIDVTVNTATANAVVISGSAINCTGAPLTNGFVDVIVGNQTQRAAITNGTFSLSIYTCSQGQTATIIVTDMATVQQSAPVSITLTNAAVAAGVISACGTSVNQFINYTFNGTTYNMTPPADSLMAYQNPQTGFTSVYGFSRNGGTSRDINFVIRGSVIGSFPIADLYVSVPGGRGTQGSNAITANITEFGGPGGFIAGSFAGNVSDSINTAPIPVTVNFRVRR